MKLSKKQLATIAILIAGLLLTTFVINSLLTSENRPSYQAQAEKVYDAAIKEVEQVRGVTLPHLPLIVVTQAWAQQEWGGNSSSPDLTSIQREENTYKGLFMMKENESLIQAQTDWVGTWIAATWNNSIYVITQYFNPYNTVDAESTLVHELTHVMQSTLNIPAQASSSSDNNQARSAMREGDADFMQNFFTNHNKAPNPTAQIIDLQPTLSSILTESSAMQDVYPNIPTSVFNLDYFPYSYGPTFVATLYAKGGWTEVNQMYKNPPNTTQQILDPEKYLAGHAIPLEVAAPKLTEEDWTHVTSDTYGEYFVLDMLNTWLPQNQTQKIADSWNGDNMTYYERGSNDFLFTWNVNWNSTAQASTFASAFQNITSAAGATKDDSGTWFSNGRYTSIYWDGGDSTIIACSSNETAVMQTNFS